ncbi:hypothetical protein J31TS4_21550 [Paenibacillus sp. J31TS4]|uniref:DUF2164 domain-containing protein n=1 Tax=Paenibacillus sp. J31TS4 TaxID=2807195 RepID=UPI001B2848DB|nr:DUF2164 domain-containing protein [Paenibacillus sp. J31TS4]GIP38875.1 hypothetical protein J31TS4_21550 [Paenibacillus sp. J31TS4]
MYNKLPLEEKRLMLEEIHRFFEEERGETIGELAAETVLLFMLRTVGPFAYNQALADARAAVMEKTASLEDELYALEKRPSLQKRS